MRRWPAMPKRSHVTIDHEQIREWAEERRGKPAVVRDTTIIRLDFPGFAGPPKLQRISWDEWFGKFEEKRLAFLHQDKMADGKRSNFNKLVSRD